MAHADPNALIVMHQILADEVRDEFGRKRYEVEVADRGWMEAWGVDCLAAYRWIKAINQYYRILQVTRA